MKFHTPAIFLISALLLFVSACKLPLTEAEISLLNNPHSIRNTLNWEGAYISTLPCGDCAGTQIVAVLRKDNTFTLETNHLGVSSTIITYSGWFIWDYDENTIILEYDRNEYTALYFEVGKDQIVMLDSAGVRFKGIDSDRYVLRKLTGLLLERRWRLTELMGEYFENSLNHIIFKIIDQRVTGFSGCNRFDGKYIIDDHGLRLKCSAARQYLCSNNHIEELMMEVFELTDDMLLNEKSLWLYSRNRILAKFELAQ